MGEPELPVGDIPSAADRSGNNRRARPSVDDASAVAACLDAAVVSHRRPRATLMDPWLRDLDWLAGHPGESEDEPSRLLSEGQLGFAHS